LIVVASVTVFFMALFMVCQHVFIGFERMKLSTVVTVVQAVVQGLLMPVLVFLGYGALGAVVGYTAAYVVAGGFSVALLYFAIFRRIEAERAPFRETLQTLKPLLSYGVPLAIAGILSGGLAQFWQFLMASSVDVALIGNYRVALNFAVLLGFFIGPISTVLFPAFSKLASHSDVGTLRAVFSSSVKYTGLFVVPVALAMVVLAQPIIGTIYGDKWGAAPLFLSLYVLQYLWPLLGSLSLINMLYGLGETRLLMKLNLVTLCLGVPLAFLLIPLFEIVGLIVCILTAGVPSLFIGLYWIWKHYATKVDYGSSAKIFLASIVSAAASSLFVAVSNTAAWVTLTVGAVVFLVVYLVAAPLIGAINQTDIHNLRGMFSGLGVISKLLDIPLTLIEKSLEAKLRLRGARISGH
jgi:stage V sporulation protein B